jgi:hypothetical protein
MYHFLLFTHVSKTTGEQGTKKVSAIAGTPLHSALRTERDETRP